MSDGSVNTTFTSDANQVIKDQARVIKQQEGLIDGYKKLAKEGQKAGKDAAKAAQDAAKELDRFAAATMKINQTPLERYKEEMFKLNVALKAGKIDQESYNRAVERAKTAFAQTAAEARQAGQAGRQAFGPSAVTELGGFIARLGGIAAAAEMARRALDAVRTEAEALGEKQFTEAPSLGMLSQVADTPEDLARLTAEAKKTFAEGGARTIPEAAKLQFALESGGAGALRADFSRLQASGVVPDATMMAESAIKLIAGMGAEEAGDFRTVVSKAFGGAKLGLGSAEELLASTATVSAQASRLGLSDEEVMAAVSTVSAVEGPAEAGTQIGALLKGIEVEGIGGGFLQPGKSLREQVARLKELEAGGADIRDMLGGRQEAVKAYGQLASQRGMASVEANLANVAKAEQEDWFGQKVQMAERIPVNAAAILKRQRQAQAELAQEEVGIYEQLGDAVAADKKEFKRRQYGGGFLGDIAAAGEGAGIWLHRFFAGNRNFVENADWRVAGSSDLSPQTAEAIGRIIGDAAAARISSGAGEPNLTNAARANQAAAGGAVEAR